MMLRENSNFLVTMYLRNLAFIYYLSYMDFIQWIWLSEYRLRKSLSIEISEMPDTSIFWVDLSREWKTCLAWKLEHPIFIGIWENNISRKHVCLEILSRIIERIYVNSRTMYTGFITALFIFVEQIPMNCWLVIII